MIRAARYSSLAVVRHKPVSVVVCGASQSVGAGRPRRARQALTAGRPLGDPTGNVVIIPWLAKTCLFIFCVGCGVRPVLQAAY